MSQLSSFQKYFTFQAIAIISIIWAVLSSLSGLILSNNKNLSSWAAIVSLMFQLGAFFFASLHCYRNWIYPKIISDLRIWLCFTLGTFSFFLGNIVFAFWELVLQREPDVSPGDLFFVVFYLFLITGIVLAINSRKIRLTKWQWIILLMVGILAIFLGEISYNPAENSTFIENIATEKPTPGFIITIENILNPLAKGLTFFYVVTDIVLLVLAATLLLTFWGGKFSQTWMAVVLAIFCLYIADVRYAYIVNHGSYESGSFMDSFWTFSGLLFAISAALEYKISQRPNRRYL